MPFDTEDVGLSIAPSPPAAMQAHDFTESQEKSMSLEGFSMAEVAYLSMCLSQGPSELTNNCAKLHLVYNANIQSTRYIHNCRSPSDCRRLVRG